MNDNVILKLTSKDDKYACKIAESIILESQKTDKWYKYFLDFAELLDYPKSLVRNRAIYILAANVQWDNKNYFDCIFLKFISHVTDNKPITARQCIKSLVQIGTAKPQYIQAIIMQLQAADLSKYKISMRPLIENDIKKTVAELSKF